MLCQQREDNEELQLLQPDKFYDKIQGKMLQLKNNKSQKLMTNEELLQNQARRQSLKNAYFSSQFDNLKNKNSSIYRYRNNNLAHSFSLQNYLNSESYNDIIFQQQQQQQLQQLSSSQELPFHLLPFHNNPINYNTNPSSLYQNMKNPFFVDQSISQIQESPYSSIGISSHAQGPPIFSSLLSSQYSKQNHQQLQNVYVNEAPNNENANKDEIKSFNITSNLKKDEFSNSINNKIESNNVKKSKDSPISKEKSEKINIDSNENSNSNKDSSLINLENKDEKEIKNEYTTKIKTNEDYNEKLLNNSKKNKNYKIDNINYNENDNKKTESIVFNAMASPPFNNIINRNVDKEFDNSFSKSIQLQSPQSQSPISIIEFKKHTPIQLRSPQSQTQTPQQRKSPPFIIPTKKVGILISPEEEHKLLSISPSNNVKFNKLNEKLKKNIEETENNLSTSPKLLNNDKNKNFNSINSIHNNSNITKEVINEKNTENPINANNNEIFSLNASENNIIEEKNIDNKILDKKKIELIDDDEISTEELDSVDEITFIKKTDHTNELATIKEISNQMEIDDLNTSLTKNNKEQNEESAQITENINKEFEISKNNKNINTENNMNILQAQSNLNETQTYQKHNYPISDSIKYPNSIYPPRMNTINSGFKGYFHSNPYMKLKSMDNITNNYNYISQRSYFYPHNIHNHFYSNLSTPNQAISPQNYFFYQQNNKNMLPYSSLHKKINSNNPYYMYYHHRPIYHPYSYKFYHTYNNNLYNNSTIPYNYQKYGYNNYYGDMFDFSYNKPSTKSPIKIPPLSAFLKEDSNSHSIKNLYNPITNKKLCKLKIKSTNDKTLKSAWQNKKRYLKIKEIDGVKYGHFSLRYLNFFLMKDKKDENSHQKMENYMTLAESIIPNNVYKIVDITSIPENKLPDYQNIFDKYIQSTAFMSLKINFLIPQKFNNNLFMNTFIFETNVFRRIKCITTVYSFGKKILETDEICNSSLKDNKFIMDFEFVNKFFTDFLSKFEEFKSYEEIQFALENLTVMQQFKDITIFNNEPRTWLILGYQFGIGDGNVDIAKVKDLGYSE